jgi:hypothetical protein
MLEVWRDRTWHDIITFDESWFYLSTDHELIWLPQDETVPEHKQYTLQSKTLMPTVVCNQQSFHLIDVLAKRHKFTAVYHVTKILSPLSKCHSAGAKEDKRKLIMHTDNASAHTGQLSV